MTVEVRVVEPGQWQVMRDVRLRALAEAPYAFSSKLATERGYDDALWQERARAGCTFLAWSGTSPVGTAAYYAEPGRPGSERQLVGMWVAPEARGSGTAGLLVEAVRAGAAAGGARRLTLFVTDGNDRAARVYERLGFRPTGERQTDPEDPCFGEARYALELP